ncbi:21734_t:CDS:2 [Racocetra persica]|uniref:21734_t:CDS:1 n=1 Tax=Racocetra persica TaxID=160502 RepID=A0ACA9S702_9GLOM|nr:21734_t:CDS:2 [Racocetra persica]
MFSDVGVIRREMSLSTIVRLFVRAVVLNIQMSHRGCSVVEASMF